MAPEPVARGNLVKESCPAFTNGCPYAISEKVLDWIKEQRPENMEWCPAFKEGCPFKGAHDMTALHQALQELPPSHAQDKPAEQPALPEAEAEARLSKPETGSPAHNVLVGIMQVVHQASQSVKESIGSDCPVFQQTCPFKNCATSSGTPLLLELETRSWGLMIPEAENHIAEETEIDVGLASKLKDGTAEAHKAAETVHFVREFIKGRVTREVYRQMVVNLFHVYAALEEALDKCWEHPLVEPLYFPEELRRVAALRADAEFYWGQDWEERTQPSPVTLEYVARLREIAAISPELIVPHAYTRYLGDLSGGQVLKRAAIRGLKLPKDSGEGVQFYMFKRIPDAKSFKNMYRARLDALEADRAVADTMVIEANYAFAMNTRMFQELDKLAGFEGDALALASAQAVQPAGVKTTPSTIPDACPFASLAAAGFAVPADHPPMQDAKKSDAKKTVTAGVRRRKQTLDEEASAGHTQVASQRGGMKRGAVLAHILVISGFVIFAWLLSS